MRSLARLLSPLRLLRLRHRCASSTTSPLPLSSTTVDRPSTSSSSAVAAATSHPTPYACSRRPLKPTARLTEEEIAQVNRLVPRLCESGRLQEAVRLLDTCLLTDPDLDALPLPAFVRRVCCGDTPGMTHAMALLTALLHNPRCSPGNLGAICAMLVDSYLEHRRPRDALKVLDWMRRPNSPCPPGPDVFGRVVRGLCRDGRTLEALRLLRDIVGSLGGAAVVGSDVRARVYKSLLREARVREAQELDSVMAAGISEEGDDGACARATEMLDRMMADWQD